MDYIGATKAANKLMTDPSSFSSAPFVATKADWSIQLNGAYNLLFPFIHEDYAVRTETEIFVAEKIATSLGDHNTTNMHFGAFSSKGLDVPVPITPIEKAILEKIIVKNYFNNNGLSTFVIKVKSPKAPDDMVFNLIGYGV